MQDCRVQDAGMQERRESRKEGCMGAGKYSMGAGKEALKR